ncbi:Ypk2p [Rhizophagus irregularis DAOM 197198w]|uniref:Ypk2p n=1 Tax=Rhizophagus irregularis (strain DAOM 197198w) TaxID=1432141 RepID=A0A015J986_RHIIW|nr:Ypk2p [Rhizophagus irregularis DAOM 197198w]
MEIFGLVKPSNANKIIEICKKCNRVCFAARFQQNFKNWTSGNNDIDKFIQDTQLSAHDNVKEVLEWIPYNRFYDIKYTSKDGFGEVYRANWVVENIFGKYMRYSSYSYLDIVNQNWKRNKRNNKMFVNLKSFNIPNDFIFELANKIKTEYEFYGMTQDPETKNYMLVLNNKCKKCNKICNAIHFQHKFIDWTSGNNDIDKFIQDTQLSAHNSVEKALEWISYDRFFDIKYISKDEIGEVYGAKWIDGNISYYDKGYKSYYYDKGYNNSYYLDNHESNDSYWNNENQNWKRNNHNMFVNLKSLNTSNDLTYDLASKIKIEYEFYGMTQDPETKNYMMVLNSKCKKCNKICNAIHFQQKFIDWTSGNDDIDKFIQDTQLSACDVNEALEWIPYDRLDNFAKNEFGKVYRAKWIDGKIKYWNNMIKNCIRYESEDVILRSLNNLENIRTKFTNDEIDIPFGITQDPETDNYMIVLKNECKKCNKICNAIHFQHKFIDWTSGNNDIDKFIQDTQLLAHEDIREALEWIPYDSLYNIKYTAEDEFGKVFRANWIDGNISYWDNKNQIWNREGHNIFVNLNSLNTLNNFTLEFINKIKIECEFYGITQDPETKRYIMVFNNKCKKCNSICNTIHFQHKFIDWTSGNNDIDKFIQDTQLSAHKDVREALEWIPYDRLYNIKYIAKDEAYSANWIDGNISYYERDVSWDNENQNWIRKDKNIYVILKNLDYSKNIASELMKEINKLYGITQDPETKNYMMALNNKCKKCNKICNAIFFQQKFIDWTSGNDDIDKFIQYTQLSTHKDVKEALEWIPYDRLYDIIYIAKGGFGKVYRANWIDGYITKWDSENQNWERYNENKFIALKSLDNSKNVTLEFMNEIILHNKVETDNNIIVRFYGITQDPKTKNYMMVLEYAEDGNLRNYLDKEHNNLNWNKMFEYLQYIIVGLKCIHEKELIHRDLHIGNILKFKYKSAITDMGLCKPANYNELEDMKNKIYGVLPYIAPEILRGQNYTKAADIYSFGIIMYEVISGLPPYYDLSHDNNLAIQICKGLRPRFNIKVPQLIVHLIKRCLDANPLNRPIAKEIISILFRWQYESNNKQTIELQVQIKEAEEINNNSSNSSITSANSFLSYNTHSEAIYTSRLLNYNNLPEPKNSDDYYEQNDNIISREFSESLQLNFSQLNINTYESCQINISQLNINENESSQISTISQLNVNEDSQNSESGSKRKNYFLSQINESESERKKIRIE